MEECSLQVLVRLASFCRTEIKLLRLQLLSHQWTALITRSDTWSSVRRLTFDPATARTKSTLLLPRFHPPERHAEVVYSNNPDAEQIAAMQTVLALCNHIRVVHVFFVYDEFEFLYLPYILRETLLRLIPQWRHLRVLGVDVDCDQAEMMSAFWTPLLTSIHNNTRRRYGKLQLKASFNTISRAQQSALYIENMLTTLRTRCAFLELIIYNFYSDDLSAEHFDQLTEACEGLKVHSLSVTTQSHGQQQSLLVSILNSIAPASLSNLRINSHSTLDAFHKSSLQRLLRQVHPSQLNALKQFWLRTELDDTMEQYNSIQSLIRLLQQVLTKMPKITELIFAPVRCLQQPFTINVEHFVQLIKMLHQRMNTNKQTYQVTLENVIDIDWLRINRDQLEEQLYDQFALDTFSLQLRLPQSTNGKTVKRGSLCLFHHPTSKKLNIELTCKYR